MLFSNLLLLLGIAFLPFPTALLAEYARRGGANVHVAAAFYSATMAFIGVAFTGIWWHLSKHPDLLVEGLDPANLRRSLRRSMVSPLVYGLTIGLAFVNALACFVVYGLLVAYFAAGPSSAALRPVGALAEPGGLGPTADAAPDPPGPGDPGGPEPGPAVEPDGAEGDVGPGPPAEPAAPRPPPGQT